MSLENRLTGAPANDGNRAPASNARKREANVTRSRKRKRAKKRNAAKPKLSSPLALFPHLNDAPLPLACHVDDAVKGRLRNALWAACRYDQPTSVRRNPRTSWSRAKQKERLSAHYLDCLERLVAERNAYVEFFAECLRCNARLRVDALAMQGLSWWGNAKDLLAFEHAKLVETERKARCISLPLPANRLEMKYLTGDLCKSWDQLRRLLWDAVCQVTEQLRQELCRLAENGTLGAIEWIPDTPPGCWATYFSTVGRCELDVNANFHSLQVARCAAVHSISLLNAYTRPLGGWQGRFLPRRPKRIQRVLNAVPVTLRDELRVVYGTRIRSLTVERELERTESHRAELRRIDFDPLLIWGELVLCGWEQEESAAELKDTRFGNLSFLIR